MTEKSDCIFCKIVAGEIPSQKLCESERSIAILDAFPATLGHALVITKTHRDSVLDMTAEELADASLLMKQTAAAVTKAVGCPAFNLLHNKGRLAGQLVLHAHFHVIPRFEDDSMKVKFSKVELTEHEKSDLAENIRKYL